MRYFEGCGQDNAYMLMFENIEYGSFHYEYIKASHSLENIINSFGSKPGYRLVGTFSYGRHIDKQAYDFVKNQANGPKLTLHLK